MNKDYGEELVAALSLLESAQEANFRGQYKSAFTQYQKGLGIWEYALTVLTQTDLAHGLTDKEVDDLIERIRLYYIDYISLCVRLRKYFDAVQALELIKSRKLGRILALKRVTKLLSTIPKQYLPVNSDQRPFLILPGIGKDHVLHCLKGRLRTAFGLVLVDTNDILILALRADIRGRLVIECFPLVENYKDNLDPIFPEFVGALMAPGPQMDDRLGSILNTLSPGFRLVVEKLKEYNINKLILVPHLGAHLIPFHLVDVGTPGNPKLVWDCFEEFVYSPSINIFMWSFSEVEGFLSGSSAVFDFAKLNFADIALHTALQIPGPCFIHIDPTLDQLKSSPHGGIWHFECHGKVETENFVESRLMIGDYSLTFQEVVDDLDLVGTWLVVLSACETGMNLNLGDLGDEYYGIDGAFLAAGATNVISSLWSVNEVSTLLIICKLYQLLFSESEPLSPASALQKACMWLKTGAWKDEIDETMQIRVRDDRKGLVPDQLLRQIERTMRFLKKFLKDLPSSHFSSCYYWGAFKCSGYGSRNIPAVNRMFFDRKWTDSLRESLAK